jgi:hypothetical protein
MLELLTRCREVAFFSELACLGESWMIQRFYELQCSACSSYPQRDCADAFWHDELEACALPHFAVAS